MGDANLQFSVMFVAKLDGVILKMANAQSARTIMFSTKVAVNTHSNAASTVRKAPATFSLVFVLNARVSIMLEKVATARTHKLVTAYALNLHVIIKLDDALFA